MSTSNANDHNYPSRPRVPGQPTRRLRLPARRGRVPRSTSRATRPATNGRVQPKTSQATAQTLSKRSGAERVQLWVSMITAVAALALSVVTWVRLEVPPIITMTMPSVIRLLQLDGTSFFIQPDFSVPAKSNATTRIMAIHLSLAHESTPGEPALAFYLYGTGDWVNDNQSGLTYFNYLTDPIPLTVSQEKPQQQTLKFLAPNQNLTSGRFAGTLTADRERGLASLVGKFCIDLSDEGLNNLRSRSPNLWTELRNDVPGQPDDCYRYPH